MMRQSNFQGLSAKTIFYPPPMAEPIQVGVRLRPLSSKEQKRNEYFAWRLQVNKNTTLTVPPSPLFNIISEILFC